VCAYADAHCHLVIITAALLPSLTLPQVYTLTSAMIWHMAGLRIK